MTGSNSPTDSEVPFSWPDLIDYGTPNPVDASAEFTMQSDSVAVRHLPDLMPISLNHFQAH